MEAKHEAIVNLAITETNLTIIDLNFMDFALRSKLEATKPAVHHTEVRKLSKLHSQKEWDNISMDHIPASCEVFRGRLEHALQLKAVILNEFGWIECVCLKIKVYSPL